MNEVTNIGEIAGLSAMLLVVGRVLKGIPRFPDEWIPTTLALVGCGVALAIAGVSMTSATVGLMTGLAAVGVNQAYRQHTNNETSKPKPTPSPE